MSFSVGKDFLLQENQGVNVGANVGADVGAENLYLKITEFPGLNTKQLNQYFDVTSRTIERWIKQLKNENRIEFVGNPKTGGYQAIKNNSII